MADDARKRFADADEEEIQRLIKEKDSLNTRRATTSSVNLFKSYLEEKGHCTKFEEFSKEELDSKLSKFYVESRRENGEKYKRTTMFSIRHGINRYLQNSGNTFDIIHDPSFSESNKMFIAVNRNLKRSGKGGVAHFPPMEEADICKMYEYFDINDPVKLQEKVFVDIMLYFGRRGRENLCGMKVGDFAVSSDPEGRMYLYIVKDEQTKNHQDAANSAEGRMYAIPDDAMCPVKTFIKYKRILNPKSDRLFQRPSKKPHSRTWYDAAPLGHNTIGNMLPSISTKAGLFQRYTNHSLRATAVHILDSTGNFAGRHIMSITGNKSENSLKTYTGYTDPKIKKKMSETLSSVVMGNRDKKRRMSSPVATETVSEAIDTDFDIVPLSTLQENVLMEDMNWSEDNFDDVLREIKTNELNQLTDFDDKTMQKRPVPRAPTTNVNQTLNNLSLNYQNLPFPVLNNCTNVTLNFNFNK